MSGDIDHSGMISAKEAAHAIGVSPQTLCEWRGKNLGPSFIRRVGRIYYTRDDIAAWQQRIRVETR